MKAIWNLRGELTMLIGECRRQGIIHLCFTMWNTEISLTEGRGCGIPSSATEFCNGKLENYCFTKDRLMHSGCILLPGPYTLPDSYILFVLIWNRKKKMAPAISLLKCFHNYSAI